MRLLSLSSIEIPEAISTVLVNRVEQANRENCDEIKQLLDDHVKSCNASHANHEARITSIESMTKKILVGWTVALVVATAIGQWVLETWIKPIFGMGGK